MSVSTDTFVGPIIGAFFWLGLPVLSATVRLCALAIRSQLLLGLFERLAEIVCVTKRLLLTKEQNSYREIFIHN
jgi:hypothetical protein